MLIVILAKDHLYGKYLFTWFDKSMKFVHG